MNNTYENIKKIRIARNFTQEYVAQRVGVSREWYGKLENGQSDISLSQLDKLAEIFNVEINDFFVKESKNMSFNYYKNGTYIESQLKDDKTYELYERMLKERDEEIRNLKNNK